MNRSGGPQEEPSVRVVNARHLSGDIEARLQVCPQAARDLPSGSVHRRFGARRGLFGGPGYVSRRRSRSLCGRSLAGGGDGASLETQIVVDLLLRTLDSEPLPPRGGDVGFGVRRSPLLCGFCVNAVGIEGRCRPLRMSGRRFQRARGGRRLPASSPGFEGTRRGVKGPEAAASAPQPVSIHRPQGRSVSDPGPSFWAG